MHIRKRVNHENGVTFSSHRNQQTDSCQGNQLRTSSKYMYINLTSKTELHSDNTTGVVIINQ